MIVAIAIVTTGATLLGYVAFGGPYIDVALHYGTGVPAEQLRRIRIGLVVSLALSGFSSAIGLLLILRHFRVHYRATRLQPQETTIYG